MTDQRDAERPIFVVGFHRSGTTLLHALIGAHPRIAAPPEIDFYGRVWAHRDRWGDLTNEGALRRILEDVFDRPTLREAGFTVESVFDKARDAPRTYAGLFGAIMADFADRNGKPRWCEKTPLQPPWWLWEQFPTAQLVHIVRDPRDSIASHEALPWETPGPAALARKWRSFTAQAMHDGEQRGPSAYLRIKYEELAADPSVWLAAVFAFLGEDFDPGVLDDPERRRATVMPVASRWLGKVLEPIKAPREGAWRENLSRLAQIRVAPVLAPLLPQFGYAPSPTAQVLGGRIVNALAAPVEAATSQAGRVRGRLHRARRH